jgi:hypothetical protein
MSGRDYAAVPVFVAFPLTAALHLLRFVQALRFQPLLLMLL